MAELMEGSEEEEGEEEEGREGAAEVCEEGRGR